MATEEQPAPREKEDCLNSSLNSQQTTSASTKEEEQEAEFGTLKSDHSKEYSFGTTEPPKLPKTEELDGLAWARKASFEAKACEDQPANQADGNENEKKTKQKPSEIQCPPSPNEAVLQEARRSGSKDDPRLSVGSLSPSSEEAFTFGTTNPLKMPDPSLLRQASGLGSDRCAAPKIEESAICVQAAQDIRTAPVLTQPSTQSFSPHPQTSQPHPHVPLPPVLEAQPPPSPPVIPPDEAVALRSQLSSSLRSFQGEVACYASPPPHQMMMQAQFMPHQMYAPSPSQPWHQQLVYFQSGFPTQQVCLPYATEVSASPEELGSQTAVDHGDHDPDNEYDTSDQAALRSSDFGTEEYSMEKLTSAFVSTKHKRFLAAGCIVTLVAIAASTVVFLIK